MIEREIQRANIQAGMRLRLLRERKQMTQRDVERETANRYGEDGRVVSQQVSRLEKGQIEKPPLAELIRVGDILGLSPADILEMYGYQVAPDRERLDPRLQEAISVAEATPAVVREALLDRIDFAVQMARAEAARPKVVH